MGARNPDSEANPVYHTGSGYNEAVVAAALVPYLREQLALAAAVTATATVTALHMQALAAGVASSAVPALAMALQAGQTEMADYYTANPANWLAGMGALGLTATAAEVDETTALGNGAQRSEAAQLAYVAYPSTAKASAAT